MANVEVISAFLEFAGELVDMEVMEDILKEELEEAKQSGRLT